MTNPLLDTTSSQAAVGTNDAAIAGSENKPLISYHDFSRLDIRLGTIESVTVVPEADKLLCLQVNCGEGSPRQIVSAIREFFADPQELVGKQCPFLVNLEPRKIRGLESQGMILAADIPGTFALLEPHPALPPGTPVH